MPEISVIVPVFNSEKYLRRCIDSILAQSFTDFELLLIDDGSSDGSPAICDEYAARDPRVRAFHKPNGGVSSARNLGLDNARGEWIAFADSDDWVDTDYLQHLMVKTEYDWRVTGFRFENHSQPTYYPLPNRDFDDSDSIKNFLQHHLSTNLRTPWGKRYKTVLIGTTRFPEYISVGEDLIFNLIYLSDVRSISSGSEPTYHYECENPASLTHVSDEEKSYNFVSNVIRELRTLDSKVPFISPSIYSDILAYPYESLIKSYCNRISFQGFKNFCQLVRSPFYSQLMSLNSTKGRRMRYTEFIASKSSFFGWIFGLMFLK